MNWEHDRPIVLKEVF